MSATTHLTTAEAVETWKQAHRFVLDVYKLSNRLPKEEHYGLIPKLRTSAVKIASNIVEGYARKSSEVYVQHLTDSQVALEETKYSLLVARDLGYIAERAYDTIMTDAEGLSERLTNLQQQLASGEMAPATEAEQPDGAAGWFRVEQGVKSSLSDFWGWFTGRRRERRAEKLEGRVWAEESPTRNYLEEAD